MKQRKIKRLKILKKNNNVSTFVDEQVLRNTVPS